MIGVLRVGNIIIAALALAAGVIALIFLPDVWAQGSAEPEDLLVLAVFVALMGMFTVTAVMSYRKLKAEHREGRPAKWLVGMNLAAAILCVVGVVLGYTSGQPSSVDMYLLTLPGLLFALNGYVLLRPSK